ncbi:MAG: GLUG motif-containing protein [Candidatus ainarchaeum sp.]|nr:GLUG motif-containing protein [Candidatus ainarchaeum sp.]
MFFSNKIQKIIKDFFSLKQKTFGKKIIAQGTIEYLIIIAIIVVIGLVVVGLTMELFDNQQIGQSLGQIKGQTGTSGITIMDSVAGLDSNGLLVLKNSNPETLTINTIIIDDEEHNYDYSLPMGSQMGFKLQNIANCDGTTKNYTIIIEYTTNYGLEKTINLGTITIDCAETVEPTKKFIEKIEEEIIYIVSFDSQEADTNANPTSMIVIPPETTIEELPTEPQKEGYIFGGWYTQINGGGTEFTTNTIIDNNITVYAYWSDCEEGEFLFEGECIACINGEGIDFFGGTGEEETPYQICDWNQLNNVRYYLDANFILINNLSNKTSNYEGIGDDFEPIGYGTGWNYSIFTGILDGNEHTISNLKINKPDDSYIGLFAYLDSESKIKNIGLIDINIVGLGYTTSFAGRIQNGLIENNYATGIITSISFSAGGITGVQYNGTINNSYFTGTIIGGNGTGGITGVHYGGTIENSYMTGNITSPSNMGGIVGLKSGGTIENSYYDYENVLINGENILTIGALTNENFDFWIENDKFFDVDNYLTKEGEYYLINNVSDLEKLLIFGQDSSLNFKIQNNLDLTGNEGLYIPYLAGNLEGNDKNILNLKVNLPLVSNIGLFGYTIGNISNIGVIDANVIGRRYVGGLAGITNGTIENIYATGNVTGYEDEIGGLIGYQISGTITNSYTTGNVTGGNTVGGLVGSLKGIITNSYTTGNTIGGHNTGGLVGNSYGTISTSYTIGNIEGYYGVGGISGRQMGGLIEKSYSTGNKTGEDGGIGGIVGYQQGGLISNTYAIGTNTGNNSVGGITGVQTGAKIENSYAIGNINDISWFAGGLIGIQYETGTIENAYATGNVTGDNSVGGLVGFSSGTITNSYWDTILSGQSNCYRDGNIGCTSTTNNETYYYNSSNSPLSSWTWGIDGNWTTRDNNYPILTWQTQ